MTVTFDTLIDQCKKVFYEEFIDSTGTAIPIEEVKELLINVRTATLREATDKAKIETEYNPRYNNNTYSINKESILNLDKNSIEI